MAAASFDSDSRTPTRCVRLLKVLVVDRDATEGFAIRLALEEAGYYLNIVTDVHEGCRRVQERTYDLVIISARWACPRSRESWIPWHAGSPPRP